MRRINKALAQISIRELTSTDSGTRTIHASHRGEVKIVQLSAMSRRKLEALDSLPISVFRVYYRTLSVGKSSGVDDRFFETTIYRNSMLMEACTYSEKNDLQPLIGIGFDQESFQFFWSGDFDERIDLVVKGGFALEIRVDLSKLELDPDSPEAKLRDVVKILTADYWWLHRANRGLGQVAEFDRQIMKVDDIAAVMLKARIQTRLVALHTGLSDSAVDCIKRRLFRENVMCQSSAGRIKQVKATVLDMPFHSLLFVTCYMMVAADPLRSVNGRGVVVAHQQYRKIVGALGISSVDSLSSSNAYGLASALRAREVELRSCPSCGQSHMHLTLSPGACPWCGK